MDQADQHQREPSDQKLAELFRHVDPREKPPESITRAIRDEVQRQWQSTVQQRRRRWQLATASLAASLVLAIVIMVQPTAPDPSGSVVTLASTERLEGTASLLASDGSIAALDVATTRLLEGQTLQTAVASGVSIQWEGGAILRLGESSELQFTSAQQVHLLKGKLYLDTSPLGTTLPAPVVLTKQGQITHVGTRYMTETGAFGTRVSVRDGLVDFTPAAARGMLDRTEAGQQLAVSDRGEISTREIRTWGEPWLWAENLATGLNHENPDFDELFRWVASETGRELIYVSQQVEDKARETRLHGKIALPPDQALEAAIATSDFIANPAEGRLVIDLKH